MRAWPALECENLDGWVLRASGGYTKRANSVQPYGPSTRSISEKVAHCERWYAARELPTVFRLTPFSDEVLDRFLAARSYHLMEPTDVLVADLPISPTPSGVELQTMEMEEWLGAYGALSRTPVDILTRLKAILQAGRQQRLLGALVTHMGGEILACGQAALEGELVGLFDLVTAEPHRRRGYGAGAVACLVGWGSARGARRAYLQVVEANLPAMALYRKLGFERAYKYWYRVRRGPAQ